MGINWTKKHILLHKKSSDKLHSILDSIPKLIKSSKNISEKDIQEYILNQFKKNKLKIDKKDVPIVAFNKNTANYDCISSKNNILKKENLILIDFWAGYNKDSPFSDMTWMFYYGKNIPKEIKDCFNIVLKCRDNCLNMIKNSLRNKVIPSGFQIVKHYHYFMKKTKFFENSKYPLGHSLGFYSAHGNNKGISRNNKKSLEKNIAYALEPGIYLKNRFGIRLELNFYINSKYELIITTKKQNKLSLI